MIKIDENLISFYFLNCVFCNIPVKVTIDYHTDEKRNVKQPPLLGNAVTFIAQYLQRFSVIKNRVSSPYFL